MLCEVRVEVHFFAIQITNCSTTFWKDCLYSIEFLGTLVERQLTLLLASHCTVRANFLPFFPFVFLLFCWDSFCSTVIPFTNLSFCGVSSAMNPIKYTFTIDIIENLQIKKKLKYNGFMMLCFRCIAMCFSYIFFFEFLFYYRLLQDTEYSSLCYTVSPCCLFYIQEHVYVNPKLLIYPSPPPSPFDNWKFAFYACGSVSVL